jgi:hypothetical protein
MTSSGGRILRVTLCGFDTLAPLEEVSSRARVLEVSEKLDSGIETAGGRDGSAIADRGIRGGRRKGGGLWWLSRRFEGRREIYS